MEAQNEIGKNTYSKYSGKRFILKKLIFKKNVLYCKVVQKSPNSFITPN